MSFAQSLEQSVNMYFYTTMRPCPVDCKDELALNLKG
jgi:hypothetical protein